MGLPEPLAQTTIRGCAAVIAGGVALSELMEMKWSLRVLAVLLLAGLTVGSAMAQVAKPVSERDKIGYMLGLDAGRSIGPSLPYLDQNAFLKAVQNTMDGGQPLLSADESRQIGQALMATIMAVASGKPAPALDKSKVGLMVGSNVGRTLVGARQEFDLPMLMRGVQDGAVATATLALDAAEIEQVRRTLSQRLQASREAARQQQSDSALQEEQAFLAKNKLEKGVFVTPSGLQYSVLRQGDGVRPRPGQRVRVHYVGTLLNGKKFDSSYDRGEPAVFGLDQVIRGWTEGVAMMPVGAKYRFWVPAALGYGERGAGKDIPPNATLMFDVELLGVE